MTDLDVWLTSIGLDKYAPVFADQEIDFELLPNLTEADVRELGLPIGPRRRLLDALAGLRGEAETPADGLERSEAERRQLTIMFVDLAQSTRLALRLDPEEMRDILRAFRDAVTSEIAQFGFVAKLMGDGVLAYFGWPRAHEDDACRAVTTALAIADAVARVDSPGGGKLACRIGIATGLVVVGDLIGEGAAREHSVVGPTPNLAARLQEAAGPGEIIIADATRRLLGTDFEVTALGKRLLKGHDEAIPLFRVLRGEEWKRQSFPSGPAALEPMVGRDAEFAALRRAWEQVKSGGSRTALITGEPGIGKSRLVQAIAEAAADEAASRVVFQCSSFHRDNPFWPIAQQLSSAAGLLDRIANADSACENAKRRRDLVETMAAQVIAAADQPAIVVFEDVQWADRATLDLLRCLSGAEVALLLIVTGRPEGEQRLGTPKNVLRLALHRLDPRAAAALLAAIMGSRQLAARIRREILARSDGIPLFIEEITKAVLETGPAGRPESVPATLRDSLVARLDVSPTLKAVAQIASCIGRDFSEPLLLQIADVARAQLEEGLAALLGSGLLLRSSPGQFRFKHALLRDIAYESLLTPRRQKLHQRIAEAIEAMPSAVAEREPETLANHWFAAGQNDRAEGYWLRARHRLTHWQEQLDALADYLESDVPEVIPFPIAVRSSTATNE